MKIQTKKIFAILTLLAFMITIMPVAAFAEATGVEVDEPETPAANENAKVNEEVDRHASIMKVDKTKVEADLNKKAEFTVYLRDNNNKEAKGTVFVASERKATDLLTPKYSVKGNTVTFNYTLVVDGTDYDTVTIGENQTADEAILALTKDAEFVGIKTNEDGKAVIYAKSRVAGDAKIALGLNDDATENVYGYLIDSDVTAADAKIIGSKTITFEATDADDITVNTTVETRGADAEATLEKDEAGKRVYKVEFAEDAEGNTKVSANNSDYYEVKFQLKSKSNAPVEDEKITFSTNKSNARLNKTSAYTDEIGEVKVRVYADKTGEYELKATKGSNWAKVKVNFDASTVDNFEVVKDLEGKVAYNEDAPAYIKLQLKDSNGNDVDVTSDTEAQRLVDKDVVTFEWRAYPSGADVDDKDWEEKNNGAKVEADNDLLKITLPKLDEEGKYSLRVGVESGKNKIFDFEAKEQGDIVKIELEYDEESLPLDTVSNAPTITRYDSEGVKLEADDLGSFDFSVSDYKLLNNKYDINDDKDYVIDGDKEEDKITITRGMIWTTDDDDYTGELVVTAIDTTNDLTAATVVVVADAASAIEPVVEGVMAAKADNNFKINILDRKGNKVALGNVKDVDFDFYVLSQPEGANVSIDEGTQFSKNLKEKGTANLVAYSEKEGKAKVSLVVSYKTNANQERKFTKTVELNFGKEAQKVTCGAKNVTLFINSTGYVVDGEAKVSDLAPFIQDNRTFVPVRIVAEALGCMNADSMWDEATQTVTLERADLTVTMTIGSNILTLSNGETVVSDVAPFIKDGRTVLPFRAIGEAFGADVEAIFAADGSVTGVTFEQNK